MLKDLSKSKIFLYGCFVFILGVGIVSFLPTQALKYDIYFFICLVGCLIIVILFWKNKRITLVALMGAILFLAFWRYSVNLNINSPDKIWYYNGQTIAFRGIVNDEPDIRENNVKLEILVEKLTPPRPSPYEGEGEIEISGKVLITTDLYPKYNYGDELKIVCRLEAPEEFQGFAYDKYLARFDIYSVCYYPKIELLNFGQGNIIYDNIFRFKDNLRIIINHGLTEPEASLARAVMLGDKRAISDDLRDVFSKIGISHIVAISGMHISILSAGVMYLFLGIGLSKKKSFYLACVFLIFYIIMIGAPASAVRAGLMGFLILLALNSGRLSNTTNSLFFVSALLLIINPRLFRDDIGFQLSFLAVGGIVYFFPIIDDYLEKIKIPKLWGIRSVIVITISAQITTLPIIVKNFSIVSIVSPVSNLFILWTLPFLMVAIIFGIALSSIFSSLSPVFFLPTRLLLDYIIKVSQFFMRVPHSYFEVNYIWLGWILFYYFFLFYLYKKLSSRRKSGTIKAR